MFNDIKIKAGRIIVILINTALAVGGFVIAKQHLQQENQKTSATTKQIFNSNKDSVATQQPIVAQSVDEPVVSNSIDTATPQNVTAPIVSLPPVPAQNITTQTSPPVINNAVKYSKKKSSTTASSRTSSKNKKSSRKKSSSKTSSSSISSSSNHSGDDGGGQDD